MSEEVFAQEQQHLSLVYQRLQATSHQVADQLANNGDTAKQIKQQLGQDATLNFDSFADNVDTFATLETMNRQIDAFNIKAGQLTDLQQRVNQLLPAPYFGSVKLLFPGELDADTMYIGPTGFNDNGIEPLIYDWRSPVADTYYANHLGDTAYQVDGRNISVTLQRRRQFILHENHLENYFDTETAVSDPLLLATLAQSKASAMTPITATIQRQQNTIIRDVISDVLLVNGIAGSGKTSVVLQRIAYLLYHFRQTLQADDVMLLTPNQLFTSYINRVLPSLGERNPRQMSLQQVLDHFLPNQSSTTDHLPTHVQTLQPRIANLSLSVDQFNALNNNLLPNLFPAQTIYNTYAKTPTTLSVPKRIAATRTTLLSQLDAQIEQMATSANAQAQLNQLTETEQRHFFGHVLAINSDQQELMATRQLIRAQAMQLRQAIADDTWLNLSAIAKLMLGDNDASVATLDLAYLSLMLSQRAEEQMKLVLIDEVQDYSIDQLIFLQALWPAAKWTLVGDENQQILAEHLISFADIKRLFEAGDQQVTQRNLLTSYRSSGAITAAFTAYGNPSTMRHVLAVQDLGDKPRLIQENASATLINMLVDWITGLPTDELTAMIVEDEVTATKLAAQLPTSLAVKRLSNSGTFTTGHPLLMSLALAKGLEFDNVSLINPTTAQFPDNEIGRHRLYTAFSRPSKRLLILTNKPLPPLLSDNPSFS